MNKKLLNFQVLSKNAMNEIKGGVTYLTCITFPDINWLHSNGVYTIQDFYNFAETETFTRDYSMDRIVTENQINNFNAGLTSLLNH